MSTIYSGLQMEVVFETLILLPEYMAFNPEDYNIKQSLSVGHALPLK
jgi:hypothetical protein